jgi:hypothetical protein
MLRFSAALSVAVFLFHGAPGPETPAQRMAAIKHAKVWKPTDVRSMNIKAGPQGPKAFTPGQTVTCDYVNKPHGIGTTPKFHCTLPSGRDLKVRYGRDNGEVYGHVAATRLFWALGFPANPMYPVKIVCRGCPPDPYKNSKPPAAGSQPVVFDPATIEEEVEGETIETTKDEGWAWRELNFIDDKAGGASLAERDALRLLAAFVQHASNKAINQRIVCLDKPACTQTVMVVADMGKTFGRAAAQHNGPTAAVNLDGWMQMSMWRTGSECAARLHWTWTGSLMDPRVKEPGRKLLADLLNQLTDAQLRDLFEVSRFTDRNPKWTVAQWVDAFKKKRAEVADRRCPS